MSGDEVRVLGGASGYVEIQVDDGFSVPPTQDHLAAVAENQRIVRAAMPADREGKRL
jgi:hypothetical protein